MKFSTGTEFQFIMPFQYNQSSTNNRKKRGKHECVRSICSVKRIKYKNSAQKNPNVEYQSCRKQEQSLREIAKAKLNMSKQQ